MAKSSKSRRNFLRGAAAGAAAFAAQSAVKAQDAGTNDAAAKPAATSSVEVTSKVKPGSVTWWT